MALDLEPFELKIGTEVTPTR